MKNLKSILLVAIISVTITSCTKNKDVIEQPVNSQKITNLYAPITTDHKANPPTESGMFTKFSFAEGKKVTGNNWDIAFRGTTIIVNGGAKVGLTDEPARAGNSAIVLETKTFANVLNAPDDSKFKQDKSGELALPKSTWYTYNRVTHLISPVTGKVLVIRTHNGHYAKMEILSYYKDNNSSKIENARYYTFNYVYNPNKAKKSLK